MGGKVPRSRVRARPRLRACYSPTCVALTRRPWCVSQTCRRPGGCISALSRNLGLVSVSRCLFAFVRGPQSLSAPCSVCLVFLIGQRHACLKELAVRFRSRRAVRVETEQQYPCAPSQSARRRTSTIPSNRRPGSDGERHARQIGARASASVCARAAVQPIAIHQRARAAVPAQRQASLDLRKPDEIGQHNVPARDTQQYALASNYT
ncbi:hypothetical protein C8R44DRAFT_364456 [Mycena epipterygia]|nr:hypothetical protein C8R44DRAFT_364456 [Mycena epipterygia]